MWRLLLARRKGPLAAADLDALMGRVRRGDALAFERLYFGLFPHITAFLSRRGAGYVCVDDVIQETFCRVWEQRAAAPDRCSAKTYVIGVALNVFREHRRAALRARRRVTCDVTDAVPAPAAVDEIEHKESTALVARARSTLSDRQAEAVRLVYDRHMSPREAARVSGCSEKAMRRRLEDARQKLSKAFGRQVGDAS